MICIILCKSPLLSRIYKYIISCFLRTADISGIRYFKRIYKFKCTFIFIHQIFVILGLLSVNRRTYFQTYRRPVIIRSCLTDSNIIIKHIQIILPVRKAFICLICDRMLATLYCKISFLIQQKTYIRSIFPEIFFTDHIRNHRPVIDIIYFDDC